MAWSLGRRTFASIRALAAMATQASEANIQFLPSVNRSMKILDRPFFDKTITIAALTILESSNISSTRKILLGSKDLLDVSSVRNVIDDARGKKGVSCSNLGFGTMVRIERR